MKKSVLAGIFFRSLSMQSSWNFRSMQNLGFAYCLIPLAKCGINKKWVCGMLTRHLRPFSSNPYLTGAIIASVARLEEESFGGSDCPRAVILKEALMAPYAAAGDPFFWGGLRLFSSVAGVILAFEEFLFAPLFLLLIYNSIHIWIRLKGFVEGYRDAKGGIAFMGKMALPHKTKILKWSAAVFIAILGACLMDLSFPILGFSWPLALAGTLVIILLSYYLISRGVSSIALLYGGAFFSLALAWV